MTWVKICGITNLKDAKTAVDAGADALGFVFYEKSSRYVTPDNVRQIITNSADLEKVGVFAECTADRIKDVRNRAGVTSLQMHVDLSAGTQAPPWENLGFCKNYIALRFDQLQQNGLNSFSRSMRETRQQLDAIFLDSGTREQPGGTGKRFDWNKAKPVADVIQGSGLNLVVAGGLTPTNVGEAMRILKPWGVDVSSGVEASPGRKDPDKVRAFIAAVRTAEKEV